ncbi:MAG: glyoxylate/hydroxypyruvate reductase A [Alphaproteobacteria bacterium]|nr:glyoxylate/hydroxypyruvate reductase A [Alphaproteobacteria bacterium]
MALLFSSQADDPVAWTAMLRTAYPDLDIRIWPEVGAVADIDVALVWKYPPGDLARYPNLKLVCSLGAGVDHLLDDPKFPDVALVRIVDPAMTAGMTEFVCAAVLRHHCQFPEFAQYQRERRWMRQNRPPARERVVGILGMGELGRDAATMLQALGFTVIGWARTERKLAGVDTFGGAAGLPAFLARAQILVCLLPLTPATRGILNSALFAQLPRGAALVNVARGAHVVDGDLLAALDAGQLSGATLDVFSPEPLPAGHPFWSHPKIFVTPHVASLTNPRTAAAQIIENIRRFRAGEKLLNQVDRALGY